MDSTEPGTVLGTPITKRTLDFPPQPNRKLSKQNHDNDETTDESSDDNSVQPITLNSEQQNQNELDLSFLADIDDSNEEEQAVPFSPMSVMGYAVAQTPEGWHNLADAAISPIPATPTNSNSLDSLPYSPALHAFLNELDLDFLGSPASPNELNIAFIASNSSMSSSSSSASSSNATHYHNATPATEAAMNFVANLNLAFFAGAGLDLMNDFDFSA